MSVAACRSDPALAALGAIRAAGRVRMRLAQAGGQTHVAELSERGGYRVALPTTFTRHVEATIINTGGGLVGGDRVEIRADLGAGADAVLSTQAAERVYRSPSADAQIDVHLSLAEGSRLDWLPQQTILYAGSLLRRRIEVEMRATSTLLMAETLTFGRPASAEIPASAGLADSWRIRRNGALVFAEELRLDGEHKALLSRPAVSGGARCAALILLVAPDAEERLEGLRSALAATIADDVEHGASAWNGMLAFRCLGMRAADVVAAVAATAGTLSRRPLPRVWSI
jgi:urease accessory protein